MALHWSLAWSIVHDRCSSLADCLAPKRHDRQATSMALVGPRGANGSVGGLRSCAEEAITRSHRAIDHTQRQSRPVSSATLSAFRARSRCRGCSGQCQWGLLHLRQRRAPTMCSRSTHRLPSAMQPAIAQRIRLSCMWPFGPGRPCDVLECDDAFDLLSCVYGWLFPLHVCANVRRRRRRRWHRGQCCFSTGHSDDGEAFSRSALKTSHSSCLGLW